MSMEKLKDLFYKELPAENKAFVEGGVLVCPQMFNIVLPTEMTDDDLYQYLSRYVAILEPLSKARNADEGKVLTKDAAHRLGVDPDEFMKNTSYLYQLESVLAGKMLPATFEEIKKVYGSQLRRARVIMIDLSGVISPQTVERSTQLTNQLTQKLLPPPPNAPQQQQPTHQQHSPDTYMPPPPPPQDFPMVQNPMVPYSGANGEEPRDFKKKLTGVLTSTPALFTYALIGGYAIYSSLVVEEEPDEEYIE